MVIYDYERHEIVCQNPECATVLDLGAWTAATAQLLSRTQWGPTPRQLILEFRRLMTAEEAGLAEVHAKYDPPVERLRNQIAGSSGLHCVDCGTAIMREGKKGVGALPERCKPCKNKRHLALVKRYRDTHPDRVKLTKRNYRQKIKKTGGQQGRESQLGGKPVGRRELRALDHYSNAVGSTDGNNEDRVPETNSHR
jgi:hypothetical protein